MPPAASRLVATAKLGFAGALLLREVHGQCAGAERSICMPLICGVTVLKGALNRRFVSIAALCPQSADQPGKHIACAA